MTWDVVHSSRHGTARAYAEALAADLGTAARALDDPTRADGPTRTGGPVILVAPIYAGRIHGLAELRRHSGDPAAVVLVGLMPLDSARRAEVARTQLGDTPAFQVPGRIRWADLGLQERLMMHTLGAITRLRRRRTESDEQFLALLGTDSGDVDLAALGPVRAWAEQARR